MNAPLAASRPTLDVAADFPILQKTIRGQRLVYLDNGATTQKPDFVIQAIQDYYQASNANIHRGVHYLSQHATERYDSARETVRAFLNAARTEEIVFTSGTTAGINLVAASWGLQNLKPKDEILLTELEHHSNIVPWQFVARHTGAVIRVAPVTDEGVVDRDAYRALLNDQTRLVGLAHVSNAFGTINPVADMIADARKVGALVLVDGAQAVAHKPVDVQALDCDFYVFSAHKLYGPTGMGALYARYDVLDAMPPWQGGGDMIHTVSFEASTYAPVPQRFEAGTPNIAGVVGMQAAIQYIEQVGLDRIQSHEQALLDYANDQLRAIPGLRILADSAPRSGIASFVLEGIHPHDLGTILDADGVAIRAGHHCAMPLMTRFGIPGTARASMAMYNTYADVDALVAGLLKAQTLFGTGHSA